MNIRDLLTTGAAPVPDLRILEEHQQVISSMRNQVLANGALATIYRNALRTIADALEEGSCQKAALMQLVEMSPNDALNLLLHDNAPVPAENVVQESAE